jgi:hypothetical protein
MGWFGRGASVGAAVVVAACQLADDKEPPKCPQGAHVENDRCVENVEKDFVARIRAGCVVAPDPFVVKSDADFQFKNEDTERHAVTGLDGKLSIDLAPGELSVFVQITKVGRYPYSVSGCADGRTIAVE